MPHSPDRPLNDAKLSAYDPGVEEMSLVPGQEPLYRAPERPSSWLPYLGIAGAGLLGISALRHGLKRLARAPKAPAINPTDAWNNELRALGHDMPTPPAPPTPWESYLKDYNNNNNKPGILTRLRQIASGE